MSATAGTVRANDFVHTMVRFAAWGILAAALIVVVELCERLVTLRGLLNGAADSLAYAALSAGYVLLLGALAGAVSGLVAVGVSRSRAATGAIPGTLRRMIAGALVGAAAAGWLLHALTMTTRFDAVIARGPMVVAAVALLGAAAAWLLPWAAIGGMLDSSRRLRRATVLLLVGGMIVVHAVNVTFAPASSYGVHVMLDTVIAVAAGAAAWRIVLPARGRAVLLVLTAVCVLACDAVARARPDLTALLRTRGAAARRAVHLWATLSDVDRDGLSSRAFTGGWDTDPLDPKRPPDPLAGRAAPSMRAAEPDTAVPAGARRANVLLLTLDALRVDVVQRGAGSPLGDLQPPTPNFDALAARSAVFDACYSPASGTEDTFRSLFAGGTLPGLLRGSSDARTLPRRLLASGYDVRAYVNDAHFPGQAWGWPRIERRDGDTQAMLTDALDAMEQGDVPVFAWFHFMDMHASVLNPFSPSSYSRRAQMKLYADGLVRLDETIGWLTGELTRRGLDPSTIVILSADHGEEMGEHGHYHHNLTLYEPAVRVPLWMRGPGIAAGARSVTVDQVSLYPTIARAAALEPRAHAGRSLWPILADPAAAFDQRPVYLFLPRRGFSRRFARLDPVRGQAAMVDPAAERKVIVRFDQESVEFYDLRADPGERENLAGSGRAWLAPLRAALDSALHHNAAPPSAPR